MKVYQGNCQEKRRRIFVLKIFRRNVFHKEHIEVFFKIYFLQKCFFFFPRNISSKRISFRKIFIRIIFIRRFCGERSCFKKVFFQIFVFIISRKNYFEEGFLCSRRKSYFQGNNFFLNQGIFFLLEEDILFEEEVFSSLCPCLILMTSLMTLTMLSIAAAASCKR